MENQTIDISTEQNLIMWCKKFNCNKESLKHAVLNVGNSVKMVDLFLSLNRAKKVNNLELV